LKFGSADGMGIPGDEFEYSAQVASPRTRFACLAIYRQERRTSGNATLAESIGISIIQV
jgi:hypothetical protein